MREEASIWAAASYYAVAPLRGGSVLFMSCNYYQTNQTNPTSPRQWDRVAWETNCGLSGLPDNETEFRFGANPNLATSTSLLPPPTCRLGGLTLGRQKKTILAFKKEANEREALNRWNFFCRNTFPKIGLWLTLSDLHAYKCGYVWHGLTPSSLGEGMPQKPIDF